MDKKEKISNIIRFVIKDISPPKEEYHKINSSISQVKQKISSHLSQQIIVGGSIAKDTFLRDARDIDMFIRFESHDKEEISISDKLEDALTKTDLNFERIHGSRDYFRLNFNSLIFEIIPIKKISSADQAQNITDISPLHVDWVTKYPQYTDDIRLAKAFAKAQGIYGAESYIRGLSGYCLEILTIYYQGFINLITNVSQWRKKEIIDPNNTHQDVISELNESKIISPLILIDPVDKQRNAAASLSEEKYDLFISSSRQFLQDPNISFFQKQKFSIQNIKEKAQENDPYIIEIHMKEGKEDVVGCKILKILKYLKKQIITNGFTLIDSGFEFDKQTKGIIWLIIKKEILPKEIIQAGPPLKNEKDAQKFKQKHPDAYEKDGRLYATINRPYTTSQPLIQDLLQNKYITQRVENIIRLL